MCVFGLASNIRLCRTERETPRGGDVMVTAGSVSVRELGSEALEGAAA